MSTVVSEICRQQQFLTVTVARNSLLRTTFSRNHIGNIDCKLCFKTNIQGVVCFLLGNSPASEFYMPTFWNTLSVPSS